MPIASIPFPRANAASPPPPTAFGYRTAAILAEYRARAHCRPHQLAPGFSGHCRDHGGDHAVHILGARARSARPRPRRPWPTRCGIRCGTLFSQKGAWGFLLLVLLYKAGDAFALSLYSTFMIKGVGFSLDELSIAGKANMTVSTIIGVAFGGWVYMRWGMFRSLLVFGIGQALTNLLYMVLALAGKKLWLMALATSLDTGVGGMGLAAFVAISRCLCATPTSAPRSTRCCRPLAPYHA